MYNNWNNEIRPINSIPKFNYINFYSHCYQGLKPKEWKRIQTLVSNQGLWFSASTICQLCHLAMTHLFWHPFIHICRRIVFRVVTPSCAAVAALPTYKTEGCQTRCNGSSNSVSRMLMLWRKDLGSNPRSGYFFTLLFLCLINNVDKNSCN